MQSMAQRSRRFIGVDVAAVAPAPRAAVFSWENICWVFNLLSRVAALAAGPAFVTVDVDDTVDAAEYCEGFHQPRPPSPVFIGAVLHAEAKRGHAECEDSLAINQTTMLY